MLVVQTLVSWLCCFPCLGGLKKTTHPQSKTELVSHFGSLKRVPESRWSAAPIECLDLWLFFLYMLTFWGAFSCCAFHRLSFFLHSFVWPLCSPCLHKCGSTSVKLEKRRSSLYDMGRPKSPARKRQRDKLSGNKGCCPGLTFPIRPLYSQWGWSSTRKGIQAVAREP